MASGLLQDAAKWRFLPPGGRAPTVDSELTRGECPGILQEEPEGKPEGEPDPGGSTALIDTTSRHEFAV